jgi:hypothetical protein
VLVSSGGGGSGGVSSSADAMAVGGAIGTGGATGGAAGTGIELPYPVGKCAEGLPGPALVNVPSRTGTYCIDATEVTRRPRSVPLRRRSSRSMSASMARSNRVARRSAVLHRSPRSGAARAERAPSGAALRSRAPRARAAVARPIGLLGRA